jgi:hypothetical protein
MRALLLAMVFTACTSSQTQPPPITIVGRYRNHLSAGDIDQIRHVASKYSHEPLHKLQVVRANKVRVQTGPDKNCTRFTVVKRGAKWLFDESAPLTAEVERTIVTY